MGPKHTGELWVYIGTPLPNPSGNTGVMLCMYVVELYRFVYFQIMQDIPLGDSTVTSESLLQRSPVQQVGASATGFRIHYHGY